MKRTTALAGKRAAVLGGGILARTAAAALSSQAALVVLTGQGEKVPAESAGEQKFETRPYSDLPSRVDLLVVATSVGDELDEEISSLPDKRLDFDLLYDLASSPGSSRLRQLAARRGLETVDAAEMMVEQVAGQFLEWTGIDPDRGLMRKVINV